MKSAKFFQITALILLSTFFFCDFVGGQQYVSTTIRPKHLTYKDSLKQIEYNYTFPILGQKAYSKGFDIPYPVGLMGNYMWMRQGILIDNMQLGLQTDALDIPLTDVDLIKFGDNTNTSYTVNFRPDLWVFPFLNVYGIFGYGGSTTEVNLVSPIELKSTVEQNLSTSGFGFMTAFGLGKMWTSVDVNWTWSKPELLDKSVKVNVFGLRLGRTFVFKEKPYRNVAFWIGGMRAKLGSSTIGSVQLSDALPPETWDRADEISNNYQDWYDGLGPLDIAKKQVADQILTPLVDRIDAADGSAVIMYGMSKQTVQMWNGVIGGQFQINKGWMIRSEVGFLGNRKSVLFSLNYRFRL